MSGMVDNPYLAFWQQVTGLSEADPDGLNDYRRFRDYINWTTDLYRARKRAIDRWSFAVPHEASLQALAALGAIVEVGAGTGYWAQQLAQRGADVRATDGQASRGAYRQETGAYYPVVNQDAAVAAAAHPDRALLLVWPPYDEDMAARALAAYRGPTVAYIGEGDGGCTGDAAFHTALHAEWDEEQIICIPQWWGVHDRLYILRRRNGSGSR